MGCKSSRIYLHVNVSDRILFLDLAKKRLKFGYIYSTYMRSYTVDVDQDLTFDKVIELQGNFSTTIYCDFVESNTSRKLMELLHHFRKLDRGPMFKFWVSFLEMVEVLLTFINASREGNWFRHLSCMCEMLPWFFAYDQVNYSRYGTYYYCTITQLEHKHHQIYEHLANSNLSVQMSTINLLEKSLTIKQ